MLFRKALVVLQKVISVFAEPVLLWLALQSHFPTLVFNPIGCGNPHDKSVLNLTWWCPTVDICVQNQELPPPIGSSGQDLMGKWDRRQQGQKWRRKKALEKLVAREMNSHGVITCPGICSAALNVLFLKGMLQLLVQLYWHPTCFCCPRQASIVTIPDWREEFGLASDELCRASLKLTLVLATKRICSEAENSSTRTWK